MLRTSLKQASGRLAVGRYQTRLNFSSVSRKQKLSALPVARTPLTLAAKCQQQRSYAIAAEQTSQGVVSAV